MLVELINKIKQEPRTTKKIELLREYSDQQSIKKLLFYAYSNTILFNVTSSGIKVSGMGLNNNINLDFFEKLIKINGRNNKLELVRSEIRNYTKDAAQVVLNVIDKDLNIGINRKIINTAFKEELIPDFALMLAFKQDEKRWTNAFAELDWCYYNVKVDGIRCVCEVKSQQEINFFSRDGKELQPFLIERIREEILLNYSLFDGCILDGEIYSNNFQKLMRVVNRKNVTMDSVYIRNSVKFKIFDLLNFEHLQLSARVYAMEQIKQKLDSNVVTFINYYKVKTDYKLISAIARKYIDSGAEGIIIKHPYKEYERKRSNYWLKFKDKNTIDLTILDVFEGELGTQFEGSLGGFVLKYKNTELRCGSGFTEEERKYFWENKYDIIGKICEISYMEETKTGSLRHPVFETIRTDKGESDE